MSRSRQFSEDYSEALREGADDLTLRAEEVKTLKACISVDHNEENRWGPPLVDADSNCSLPRNIFFFYIYIFLELEGVNGKSCTFITER